jgi:hypothetical protein
VVTKGSVSDSSEGGEVTYDVGEVIVRELSSGPKTPKELKNAVVGFTGVSVRVYYRHLQKLHVRRIVEEKAEISSSGKVIKRYALKKHDVPKNLDPIKEQKFREHVSNFSKEYWELNTWVDYNPLGWTFADENDEIMVFLINSINLGDTYFEFPKIVKYNLDPDRYVFDWPIIFREVLKIVCPIPRFFNLKNVYQAKCVREVNSSELKKFPLFLGVKEFVDGDGVNRQIAVVVCRRSSCKLQVCRVEFFPYFSEKWIDELSSEYNCSEIQIFCPDDIVLMRRAVFHLDDVLQNRRLRIPLRYSLLFDDLRLFNFRYTPPKPHNLKEQLMLKEYLETGGNFVHALAASVLCADGLKTKSN